MKKDQVEIGGLYTAKVSDKLVTVRIDSPNSHGGWNATNTATGKCIRIKSAQRLRGRAREAAKVGEHDDTEHCELCERPVELVYMEHPLCARHWSLLSGDDENAARQVAQQLGVMYPPQQRSEQSRPATENETPAEARAPRSELTLEEAEKLAKVRAARAKTTTAADPKPRRVSALDAAAEVLKAEGKPMRAKDLIEVMAAKGLWSSLNGRTPEATLYAAMIREIRRAVETGTVSRFRKTDRGQFEYNEHHA